METINIILEGDKPTEHQLYKEIECLKRMIADTNDPMKLQWFNYCLIGICQLRMRYYGY